jgi:demethylmenaquinone methyltransferase / 2-methoxy-6-polyprenyl-1,4-benzoquinol methylase
VNVDKSEDRIRRMFGEISGRYDFLNHVLSLGVDYSWRRRAVRAVPADIRGPILDVCTGTGDLAIAFWKKFRGRVEVVGSDFTPEMLEIANLKRDKRDIPDTQEGDQRQPLTFVEADTQDLPFENDRFEAVSVAFGLRNVTEIRRGIREMIRVCRPGGHVLILEFGMPRSRLFGAFYRWYFKRVLPRLGQLLARNRQSAYHYLPESVSEFPHGPALVELLAECGLEEVIWKPLTMGIAGLYVGRKPAELPPAEPSRGEEAKATVR